jgi:hypothetical protein
MPVTTVSIRIALKRIAEITCGMSPRVIPVAVHGSPPQRVFVASIPFEYKSEVCAYLAEHLGIEHSVDGYPLVLTLQQASALLELPLKENAGQLAMQGATERPDRIA